MKRRKLWVKRGTIQGGAMSHLQLGLETAGLARH
jgi:hypothetical protein